MGGWEKYPRTRSSTKGINWGILSLSLSRDGSARRRVDGANCPGDLPCESHKVVISLVKRATPPASIKMLLLKNLIRAD